LGWCHVDNGRVRLHNQRLRMIGLTAIGTLPSSMPVLVLLVACAAVAAIGFRAGKASTHDGVGTSTRWPPRRVYVLIATAIGVALVITLLSGWMLPTLVLYILATVMVGLVLVLQPPR
jgi:hypothetical protein